MKKLYYLDESEKERILVMHKKHKENLIIEQDSDDSYFSGMMKRLGCLSKFKNMGNNIFFDEQQKFYYYPNGTYIDQDSINQFKIDQQTTLPIKLEEYALGTYSCTLEMNAFNQSEYILRRTPYKEKPNGWRKYRCVIDKGAEATKDSENSYKRYSQTLKDTIYYYPNGTFKAQKDLARNAYQNTYYCDADGNIQTGSQKNPQTASAATGASTSAAAGSAGGGGGGYQQVAGGYLMQNAFTPQKVSTIKQAVGSTDKSGTLTQDDINKLYAKLS
jgi:hypothetical protein